MRFAALQGSGVNDYIRAGKSGADAAVKAFAINRKTGPDYGEIAKTGMAARSAERQMAMKTGAQVTKAGINAVANVQKIGIQESAEQGVRDIGAKIKKAGAIAGLGRLVGAGYLASRDNTKGRPRPSNTDAMRSLYADYVKNRDGKIADREGSRTTFNAPEYKPSDTSSPSSAVSSNGSGAGGKSVGGVSPGKPSEYGTAYMSLLTNNGMSKAQAAALTGHLEIESDSFRADTEYAPNAYGTRGRGHLQWTDTGSGGGRRTNFENFASSKGLDPKSFEANSQFLLSELQGNHGNHWTNGASYQGFLATNSLQEASSYLQNNYIRPGVPHTERRLSAAQNYFNNFGN